MAQRRVIESQPVFVAITEYTTRLANYSHAELTHRQESQDSRDLLYAVRINSAHFRFRNFKGGHTHTEYSRPAEDEAVRIHFHLPAECSHASVIQYSQSHTQSASIAFDRAVASHPGPG